VRQSGQAATGHATERGSSRQGDKAEAG
jgi:hypothetical protein